jgi:hypothetical protein
MKYRGFVFILLVVVNTVCNAQSIFSFRGFSWGASLEYVIKHEKNEDYLLQEESGPTIKYLYYKNVTVLTYESPLVYYFIEDKLAGISCEMLNKTIDEYNDLQNKMGRLYGNYDELTGVGSYDELIDFPDFIKFLFKFTKWDDENFLNISTWIVNDDTNIYLISYDNRVVVIYGTILFLNDFLKLSELRDLMY